ncbi:MAG: hypothetical protein EA383_10610 [Spirochaetaceae bacterium]|nr:MAG: hypothetical protein EA383_10610 [Spirochaetaceae bacterium]
MVDRETRERIEAAVSKWFRPFRESSTASAFEQLSNEYLADPELRMVAAQACKQHGAASLGKSRADPDDDEFHDAWHTVADRVWELLPELEAPEQPLLRIAVSALVTGGFQDLVAYRDGALVCSGLNTLFQDTNTEERERRIRFVVEAMEDDMGSAGGDDRDPEPWAAALYVIAVELSAVNDAPRASRYRRDPLQMAFDAVSSTENTTPDVAKALFTQARFLEHAVRQSSELKGGIEILLAQGESHRYLQGSTVTEVLGCAFALSGSEPPLYDTVWFKSLACVLGEGARHMSARGFEYPDVAAIAQYLLSLDGYHIARTPVSGHLNDLLHLVDDVNKLLRTASDWLHRDPPTHEDVVTTLQIALPLLAKSETIIVNSGGENPRAKVMDKPILLGTTVLLPENAAREDQKVDWTHLYPAHTLCTPKIWAIPRAALTTIWYPTWESGSRNECLELIKTPGFYRDMVLLNTLFHYLLYVDDQKLIDELEPIRDRVTLVARYAVQGLTVATREHAKAASTSISTQALFICAYYGSVLLLISGEGAEAVSSILHAWRIQDKPGLSEDLDCPDGWIEVRKNSTASAIAWIAQHLFRGQYEHTRDADLRHEFVLYCLKRFQKARKPRETPPEAGGGWDGTRNEPSPLWRAAYVRALRELEGNPNGQVFRTLQAVANRDTSPEVRREAEQTLEAIGNIRGNYSGKSHRKAMLNAWFELRRAHMEELSQGIDEEKAEIVRWKEVREY